eukprot:4368-Heterococcus_DN1.PRE.2
MIAIIERALLLPATICMRAAKLTSVTPLHVNSAGFDHCASASIYLQGKRRQDFDSAQPTGRLSLLISIKRGWQRLCQRALSRRYSCCCHIGRCFGVTGQV